MRSRATGRPVDRTTAPVFRPVIEPRPAPTAPAIEPAALHAALRQQAAAAVAKRRRQEAELLLLVA
jgi:hypothetical protein